MVNASWQLIRVGVVDASSAKPVAFKPTEKDLETLNTRVLKVCEKSVALALRVKL